MIKADGNCRGKTAVGIHLPFFTMLDDMVTPAAAVVPAGTVRSACVRSGSRTSELPGIQITE